MTQAIKKIVDKIVGQRHVLSEDSITASDLLAYRVGRNNVWRISSESHDTVWFAKIWNDESAFIREFTGLKLALSTAADNASVVAANIVLVDQSKGVIVTDALVGKSLSDHLRLAYRYDKNLLRRHSAIDAAIDCLHHVLIYLESFHKQPLHDTNSLLNHSLAGTKHRLLAKVKLAAELPVPELGELLRSTKKLIDVPKILSEDKVVPVFGDASPQNFIYTDNKIGAIDFEDFGFGDSDRDYFVLAYHINRLEKLPHYHKPIELMSLLPDCPPRKATLYVLESGLDQVLSTQLDHARPKGSSSIKSAIKNLRQQIDTISYLQ